MREYETGFYEYTDEQGYKRIGKWKQEYQYDGNWLDEKLNRRKVGVVDYYEDEDDDYVDGIPDRRRECLNCYQHGFVSKLGPRTWSGKKPPEDNHLFLQCYTCGNVYPKHEIKKESKLKVDSDRETTDNPFEAKEGIVMSVPSRTSPAGKRALAKKKKSKTIHPDKDIQREIHEHGEENVKILFDSNH